MKQQESLRSASESNRSHCDVPLFCHLTGPLWKSLMPPKCHPVEVIFSVACLNSTTAGCWFYIGGFNCRFPFEVAVGTDLTISRHRNRRVFVSSCSFTPNGTDYLTKCQIGKHFYLNPAAASVPSSQMLAVLFKQRVMQQRGKHAHVPCFFLLISDHF